MDRPAPRSVVGIDPGLMTFACAHVRRVAGRRYEGDPVFELVSGRVYVPPSRESVGTVAEETAVRVLDLDRWLLPVLAQAIADGAESFHAERYEQLRQSSAAAKYAAGHAVLTVASARTVPKPPRQDLTYVSGRDAKRAVTGCDVATKAVVIAAARRLVAGAGEALRALLAGYRPHLADAIAVALHALGRREWVSLIGEGPAIDGNPLPFSGPAFAQLRSLAGGDVAMAAFSLANLLVEPVGFEGSRTDALRPAFPMREANARALALEPGIDGRSAIFVGALVAEAFEVAIDDPLAWHEVRCEGGPAYMAAVLPHPITEERWWKDPKNVARARMFLRAAAKRS